MASLTISTLGDLDTSYELCGVCCACRAMRALHMRTLLKLLGMALAIAQVRHRTGVGIAVGGNLSGSSFEAVKPGATQPSEAGREPLTSSACRWHGSGNVPSPVVNADPVALGR